MSLWECSWRSGGIYLNPTLSLGMTKLKGQNQNKQIHAEFFYLVLMRSAAYKALQERATRTACSQATLPLHWLAEIQFFQSFPEWHGVKFVAHRLCPHSLVTACTLWHGKQRDPNLLPAFEIKRVEGSWYADRSTRCFVKTQALDQRCKKNENRPLEKLQASETSARVRSVTDRWRLEVSVFVLYWIILKRVHQASSVKQDITHRQATLHNGRLPGCSGSPSTFMKALPVYQYAAADPEMFFSDHSETPSSRSRAELPRSCANPAPHAQDQSKQVPTSASGNGLHF